MSRPGVALPPGPVLGAAAAAHARPDGGLVTLEWLLIIGAVAGLSAASVLAVQNVVDGRTEVRDDPAVQVIDADIAAAFIEAEANEAELAGTYSSIRAELEQRCTSGLQAGFAVVESAVWRDPVNDPNDPAKLSRPAKCTVQLKPNLGG